MPETATLEPEREVVRDEPAEARAEERSAERRSAPPTAHDERLLPLSETAEFRRRWESIQTSFIDSPEESVEEADRLVADLTDRIADGFRSQRAELEARWHRGEKISTEALRQSLQRYREFFDRLLKL